MFTGCRKGATVPADRARLFFGEARGAYTEGLFAIVAQGV